MLRGEVGSTVGIKLFSADGSNPVNCAGVG